MSKTIIFDLDGTIYRGDTLIDDSLEVVSELQRLGHNIVYYTNNSTLSSDRIYKKLCNFGVSTTPAQIFTASHAISFYLQEKKIQRIFLIGSNDLKQLLIESGIEIVSSEDSEAVVVGLDVKFNYDTIARALQELNKGASFIVANRDRTYPVEGGILKPGTNVIVSAIEGCCNKKVDFIAGKPNVYMLKIIAKKFNLTNDDMWVVGDSMDSDIEMAKEFGSKSILVGPEGLKIKSVVSIIEEDLE